MERISSLNSYGEAWKEKVVLGYPALYEAKRVFGVSDSVVSKS